MDIEKEKTFKMLFEKHYQQLYQHALSFMKDEETAKDIVNDVFLFFWKTSIVFPTQHYNLCLLMQSQLYRFQMRKKEQS